jgi:hypothetical protein
MSLARFVSGALWPADDVAAQQGVAADELVAPASPSLWRSQLNAGTLGRSIRMVISHIKEKLQKYPHVTYTTTEGHLEIPAQSPTGFRVWIHERADGCSVGFDGWHEEFTDADEAVNCFAFGLSTACRLRVFSLGSADYKWQVLHKVDGQWVADSETSLFVFPFWRGSVQRDLQNDIISAA